MWHLRTMASLWVYTSLSASPLSLHNPSFTEGVCSRGRFSRIWRQKGHKIEKDSRYIEWVSTGLQEVKLITIKTSWNIITVCGCQANWASADFQIQLDLFNNLCRRECKVIGLPRCYLLKKACVSLSTFCCLVPLCVNVFVCVKRCWERDLIHGLISWQRFFWHQSWWLFWWLFKNKWRHSVCFHLVSCQDLL